MCLFLCLPFLVTLSYAADENQNACKGDPSKWQQLFNGKDLNGWKHVGPGGKTVEDGLIHTHGGMGLLYWTGGKIGNCVIRVVYKMRDENDNSGVFIRIPAGAARRVDAGALRLRSADRQSSRETSKEDEYHSTGMLYSLTKPLAKAWKPGPEWNTMEITLDGPRTIVMLNGVKVTDYTGRRSGSRNEVRFRAATRSAARLWDTSVFKTTATTTSCSSRKSRSSLCKKQR